MEINLEIQKKLSSEWFLYLQSLICKEFEQVEAEYAKKKKNRPRKFKKRLGIKKITKKVGVNILY